MMSPHDPKLFKRLASSRPPSPPLTPPGQSSEESPQPSAVSSFIQPSSTRPITSIPLKQRPPNSKSLLRVIAFNFFFFFSVISLHITQLFVFSFLWIRPGFGQLFWKFNSLAKQTFGIILLIATQVFAPTSLVITTDEGLDLNQLVTRDHNGDVKLIDLPKRSVIMANHQIYADWLYIWSLAYLAELHGSIIIILKASLKWMPIVGPAMQMFSFIFLNRSWASDRDSLAAQLTKMAEQVSRNSAGQSQYLDRLALLIFPEGTLVSPLTRPISKRFADKHGYADLRHCLLPRSTGSLFCIRALNRKIPDLQLIDLTIGYPGIPSDGYGQDYYTLQSIFGHGYPPPQVHIHMRIIPVAEIPIGTGAPAEPTAAEAATFDAWLRAQWTRKDEMLAKFYKDGVMCDTASTDSRTGPVRRIESKIELRGVWDPLRTIILAVPGVVSIWLGWIVQKVLPGK